MLLASSFSFPVNVCFHIRTIFQTLNFCIAVVKTPVSRGITVLYLASSCKLLIKFMHYSFDSFRCVSILVFVMITLNLHAMGDLLKNITINYDRRLRPNATGEFYFFFVRNLF